MARTDLHRRRAIGASPWIALAIGVIVWQGLAVIAGPRFLPGPIALVNRLAQQLASPPTLEAIRITLAEALTGTALAVLVAVPLGYLIGRVRWADAALTPYVAASQALPAVAIAPLLALWLGYGLMPIAVLCALVAFFPMLVTTTLGFRSLPRDLVEAARLDGASLWQRLTWIEFPLALPSVLAGIRAGITLSVTGAVVGEFTMGGHGLGMLLTLYRDSADTEGLFATIALLVLLALLLYFGVRTIEQLVRRRRPRIDRPADHPMETP